MIFLYVLFIALSVALTGCAVVAQQIKPIGVGDTIDAITLLDQDGNPQTLSSFKGQKLVIYFYPKDNTPGCTKQACSLRDTYDVFKKHHIQVIGINYENPAHHKAFKQKYKLPFMLLSDTDKRAAKRLGAYKGLTRWFMPARTTILVNEDGVITHIMRNVDVTTHTQDVLKNLGISNDRT